MEILRKYIAIDLGGTKTSAAIVNSLGELSDVKIVSSPFGDGLEAVKNMLFSLINGFLEDKGDEIEGIGIAAGGRIDGKTGAIVRGVPLCEGYVGFKLKEIISNEFQLNTYVMNDANAAAYAEYLIGAGKNAERLACITIGTGIGGGVVINGKMIDGFGNAGELGHIIIDKGGRECGCGQYGCLERYVSRKRIAESIAEAYKKGLIKTELNPNDVNSEVIIDLITKNEPVVVEIFEETMDYLAAGIMNIVNIIDPDLVLVSGQLSKLGDRLISSLKNKIPYDVNIKTAMLENNSGLIGAGLLCAQSAGRR